MPCVCDIIKDILVIKDENHVFLLKKEHDSVVMTFDSEQLS